MFVCFYCLRLKDRPAAWEKRSLFVDCVWKRDLPAGARDHLSYSETAAQPEYLFVSDASESIVPRRHNTGQSPAGCLAESG